MSACAHMDHINQNMCTLGEDLKDLMNMGFPQVLWALERFQ